MSPTEEDLRAALRLEESDAPSGYALIGLAHEARRNRRRNVLYSAASMCAVLVVAGIAWGAHNVSNTKGTASSALAVAPEAAAGHGGFDAASATGQTADCPSTYGFTYAPVASPGSASQPVFGRSLASMTLCLYDTASGSVEIGRVTLAAEQAQTRADAINAQALPNPSLQCPYPRYELLILTTDTSGRSFTATSMPCGVISAATGGSRDGGTQLESLIDLARISGRQSVAAQHSTATPSTGLSNPVSGVPMSHGPGPS